ncbi:hypothetical protein [Pseudonocardia sediminis]|uniref:hypothetical protein n=1 Tax=Pseudonocardia sediminis TaxID=1397368 RepID=UPI001028CC9C|nr:hypothetical protein [Pseudonocardia sediminis]
MADPDLPEFGSVATMTVVPSVQVHTSDPRPGAELIDAVLADLLARGFGLVSQFGVVELTSLPVPPTWSARLDAGAARLTIAADAVFYDGDLGSAAPAGWLGALRRRGLLVLLVCSDVDLARADRTSQIAAAGRRGGLVGAQISLRETSGASC